MVGEAGVPVLRAADEAAAVGQQRQAEDLLCVVREDAQDVAVVDVEELNVVAAGERVHIENERVTDMLSRRSFEDSLQQALQMAAAELRSIDELWLRRLP